MRIALSSIRTAALVALVAIPALAQAQQREAIGRSTATLTQAIRVGNMVYASGALPTGGANADTTIQGQTRSALGNIKTTLELAGTTMQNAVKCTVFLIEGSDFRGMNEAYAEFWPVAPPARSTVVVKALVAPNAKLEIECIAVMPVK